MLVFWGEGSQEPGTDLSWGAVCVCVHVRCVGKERLLLSVCICSLGGLALLPSSGLSLQAKAE